MRPRKRLLIATLAAGMIAALPGTALGQDRAESDVTVTDRVSDSPIDRPIDRPTEKPSDLPSDKPTDRPTERPTDNPIDRCLETLTDRRCVDDKPTDRPVDRCLTAADHLKRCVDDHHPHDINVRQLIWRLIKAHEWEKLVRLLHWLGWL